MLNVYVCTCTSRVIDDEHCFCVKFSTKIQKSHIFEFSKKAISHRTHQNNSIAVPVRRSIRPPNHTYTKIRSLHLMMMEATDIRRQTKHQLNNDNRNKLLTKRSSKSKSKSASPSATAAQEAREITSSLRRTKIMMQQELNRISNVSESIVQDGIKLNHTKEQHIGMKGGIKGAKGSLNRLKLKEKEDEIIFWASIVFFYVVVLYVLWTRIRIPFLLW